MGPWARGGSSSWRTSTSGTIDNGWLVVTRAAAPYAGLYASTGSQRENVCDVSLARSRTSSAKNRA